jgi:hypothetical protein
LEEIRKRAEAASLPPWYAIEHEDMWQLFSESDWFHFQIAKCPKFGTNYMEYWPKPEDSDFIANARQDIPDLLDYIEELRNPTPTFL